MGREQALAETFGRTEDQAHREEQGTGGSTKTNQSSQRDTSTVRKLSWGTFTHLCPNLPLERFHCISYWLVVK